MKEEIKTIEQSRGINLTSLQNEPTEVKRRVALSLRHELGLYEEIHNSGFFDYDIAATILAIKFAVDTFGNPGMYKKEARDILEILKADLVILKADLVMMTKAMRIFLDLGIINNADKDKELESIMVGLNRLNSTGRSIEYAILYGQLVINKFIQDESKINAALDTFFDCEDGYINRNQKIGYMILLRIISKGGITITMPHKLQAYKITKELYSQNDSEDKIVAAETMLEIGPPTIKEKSRKYLLSQGVNFESNFQLSSNNDKLQNILASKIKKDNDVDKYRELINKLIDTRWNDSVYIYYVILLELDNTENLESILDKRFAQYKIIKKASLKQEQQQWNRQDKENLAQLQSIANEETLSLILVSNPNIKTHFLDILKCLRVYTTYAQQPDVLMAIKNKIKQRKNIEIVDLQKLLLAARIYIKFDDNQKFIKLLEQENFHSKLDESLLTEVNEKYQVHFDKEEILLEEWYKKYFIETVKISNRLDSMDLIFLKLMLDKFLQKYRSKLQSQLFKAIKSDFKKIKSTLSDMYQEGESNDILKKYIIQKLSSLSEVLASQQRTNKFRIGVLGRLNRLGVDISQEKLKMEHNNLEVHFALQDKVGDKYEELFQNGHEKDYKYNVIYEGREFKYELDGYNEENNQALEIKSHHNKIEAALKNGFEKSFVLFKDTNISSVRIVAYSEREWNYDFVIKKMEGGFVIEDIKCNKNDEYVMRTVDGKRRVEEEEYLLNILQRPISSFFIDSNNSIFGDENIREIEYLVEMIFNDEGEYEIDEESLEDTGIKYSGIKDKIDKTFPSMVELKYKMLSKSGGIS